MYQEFRDDLALHFKKPPLSLHSVCDVFGSQFIIEHALVSYFGAFITHRHNQVWDDFGDHTSF